MQLFDYLSARFNVGGEEGQTMAEYAVVLAVITVLVITALTFLSGSIGDALTKLANTITNGG